jgi:calcium permeable stress-gated cation channel
MHLYLLCWNVCDNLYFSGPIVTTAGTVLTYQQGYRARSWIEYSLLRKCVELCLTLIRFDIQSRYFLFLLVNVVFIFLLASTYWQLVRELANSPAKVPERLAMALQQGKARHFFLR